MTTTSQKKRFYAIAEDFSRSGLMWAGKRRSKDEWKLLLMSGHKAATRADGVELVEGFEGELIDLRESLVTMSTKRGASLIEYSQAMAGMLGVKLNDPEIESLMTT